MKPSCVQPLCGLKKRVWDLGLGQGQGQERLPRDSFQVERVRDGRSFATRTVKVRQRNRVIFQLTASFHRSLSYSSGLPGLIFVLPDSRREPGPEFQMHEHLYNFDSIKLNGSKISLPSELISRGKHSEPTSGADLSGSTESLTIAEGPHWSLRWCRHTTKLPNDAHESILAWISDSGMVSSVRRPHGDVSQFSMGTSLDHSIHFHREFRVDEWLLFHTRTSISTGARGLATTEVFTQAGTLIATINQEALIRMKKPHATSKL